MLSRRGIDAAFLTGMAFSTVPSPLYPLYQARNGFSTFTVTIVFAVYAVGVLASLLLAGHISDWAGRKKVLIAALLLELIAAALFLAEPSLPILITARLVTGLGVGMLTATATAHLHSAHRPGASAQRFEIVSTTANLGGLGVGPLLAGILAQFLNAPLFLPYLICAALLLISIAAVLLTPETVEPRFVEPAYRPQRISTDYGDPAGYLAAAAAGPGHRPHGHHASRHVVLHRSGRRARLLLAGARFRASDWIKRNAVFMRSANNYHHSLGIFRSSPERAATMDHFCILVDSIDDVMRARNVALRSGAKLQKDVLRHAASGSISVYIADPMAGMSFEFCVEHNIVGADHRPRGLESTPISRDVWLAGTPKEEIAALTGAAMGVTSGVTRDDELAAMANSMA